MMKDIAAPRITPLTIPLRIRRRSTILSDFETLDNERWLKLWCWHDCSDSYDTLPNVAPEQGHGNGSIGIGSLSNDTISSSWIDTDISSLFVLVLSWLIAGPLPLAVASSISSPMNHIISISSDGYRRLALNDGYSLCISSTPVVGLRTVDKD